MKTAILLLVLFAITTEAHASVAIDNSQVINNISITTSAAYAQTIDLSQADSASWQTDFTCSYGSWTLRQSNDGLSWSDINLAGSSVTVKNTVPTTFATQLYAIANPAYRYVNFIITNSSAPANNSPSPATPCTFKAKQLLRSLTVQSN